MYIFILALCSAFFTLSAKSVEKPLDQLVKKITEQRKLLRFPECADYLYIPNGEPGIDIVDVVEKHTEVVRGTHILSRQYSVCLLIKKHTKWSLILIWMIK